MGLELEYIDGQTPLDEDEKGGLKICSSLRYRSLEAVIIQVERLLA